ncbi:hypothetical protein [Candidatus Ichthyocystis hellenicum]|uniref:hypothetical protein n=1 Tax=Candidatus Ichthyocystis hellenicum TaxID=1561003 RepID=UPI000B8713F0|nr:hypothetical protein [Candidatus Ichthyocystis hellenicum]
MDTIYDYGLQRYVAQTDKDECSDITYEATDNCYALSHDNKHTPQDKYGFINHDHNYIDCNTARCHIYAARDHTYAVLGYDHTDRCYSYESRDHDYIRDRNYMLRDHSYAKDWSCADRDDIVKCFDLNYRDTDCYDKLVKMGMCSPSVSVEGFFLPFTTDSNDHGDGTPNISFLSDQLRKNLYGCYIYDINVQSISEVLDDNFLQLYANKCGYVLTEDFLSDMIESKNNFLETIDFIICNNFNFLKEFEHKITNESMNKICHCFFKESCNLRPKFVNALQSSIFPTMVNNIFDSKAICGDSEREMTYSEMEQLFLCFASILEKLIMSRIMSCWSKFYNEKKTFLSLLSSTNYSNPFHYIHRCSRTNKHETTYPSSFIYRFGKYISFMANCKIDGISYDFVEELVSELKKVIRYKCINISNYSSNIIADIKEFRIKLQDFIKKEFDKKIVEVGMKDNLSNFLSKLIIWDNCEFKAKIIDSDILLVIELIINDMYKLLSCHSGSLSSIIRSLNFRMERLGKITSRLGVIRTIENKWGVKLHPSYCSSILSIRKKYSAKSRDAIVNKFSSMMEEKYKFSDGTIIGDVSWGKISKNIFPIAQETVMCFLDEERLELIKLLSDARVVENDDIFDGSYGGTRDATSREKDIILKIAINNLDRQTRDLSRKTWSNLISSLKNNVSKDVCSSDKSEEFKEGVDLNASLPTVKAGISANTALSQSKYPVTTSFSGSGDLNYSSFGTKIDKVYSRLGLNLHPDDYKLILFVRKKFSESIKNRVFELFSSILEKKTVLSSGRTIHKCSWALVSSELYPVAMDSIGLIIDEQHKELDKILSKSRVINVTTNDSYSLVIRKITDGEKDGVMLRIKEFIRHRLRFSFREVWVSITKISRYGYKEVSKNFYENDTDGAFFGIRLRYSDSMEIFRVRRKYSSRIRRQVYNKFYEILKNGHKFDDDSTIGKFAWSRVSKNLFPIAYNEIKPIIGDENKVLKEIISRARVVVNYEFDREITSKEKSVVLRNIIKLVSRELKNLFRRTWISVINSFDEGSNDFIDFYAEAIDPSEEGCIGELASAPVSAPGIVESGKKLFKKGKNYGYGINLRYEDDIAILNARRGFSSYISKRIYNKFSEMLKNRYRFDDDTTIGMVAWFRVSRNILPIAIKEIKHVLEYESKVIREIVSGARVVVNYKIDREITDEEKSTVFINTMRYVNRELKSLFRKIWLDVIASLGYNGTDVEVPTNADAVEMGGDCSSVITLHYKDDIAILNTRRRFSSRINRFVSSKFCEMLKNRYEFVDGTVVDVSPWRRVSKNILPIIKKEVGPFVEEERIKINDILLKARVVATGASSDVTRELTVEERSRLLTATMKNVHRQMIDTIGRLWGNIVNSSEEKNSGKSKITNLNDDDCSVSDIVKSTENSSLSVGFMDLRDTDITNLDNIRLEFFGSLSHVIDEVFTSLLLELDSGKYYSRRDGLDLTISKRSYMLLKEGGFIERVMSLVSSARVSEGSGKYRAVTDEESKSIFQTFMDSIDRDINYLIRKRAVMLLNRDNKLAQTGANC